MTNHNHHQYPAPQKRNPPSPKEFTITMRITCILLIGLIQLAQTPVEDLLAAARKEEKDEEEDEGEEGDEDGSQDIENTSHVS